MEDWNLQGNSLIIWMNSIICSANLTYEWALNIVIRCFSSHLSTGCPELSLPTFRLFHLYSYNDYVVVSNIFDVHPYLGKIPNLTSIFQRGWFNHQLDDQSIFSFHAAPLQVIFVNFAMMRVIAALFLSLGRMGPSLSLFLVVKTWAPDLELQNWTSQDHWGFPICLFQHNRQLIIWQFGLWFEPGGYPPWVDHWLSSYSKKSKVSPTRCNVFRFGSVFWGCIMLYRWIW